MLQSDLEIAHQARLRPIVDVAGQIGLRPDDLEMYGRYKAKLPLRLLRERQQAPDGRLVLVTAITPTPAGEGKTTTTVGLGQALWRLGKRTLIALREPSLGPVFGVKGGAAGGGFSQVVPMEDINLHFTGDFHAITSAHNLLAALLDNHLQHGNELDLDPRRITWRRVLDMNDRGLRHTVVGLGGRGNGVPREDGFMITVASEIMATLCLASGLTDLKERLGRMIVGYTHRGAAVRADELGAVGAMAVLLKDALQPNLVQTLEGTPALVHGGPFANIAHGANSLLATRLGLKLGDYLVTEAGFGSDLGAEKFFHIVSRLGGLRPACVVLVATVRALKMHGGVGRDDLSQPDPAAVERGLPNLEGHLRNLMAFGVPVVVAINPFPTDQPDEIAAVRARCEALGVPCAVADVFQRGGAGGEELARLVVDQAAPGGVEPRYAYPLQAPIPAKIEAICKRCYGADGVDFTPDAEQAMKRFARMGFAEVPICMAKTQYSFSDDPSRPGRPEGFRITLRDLSASAGAGFLVAYTGDILTMPGLPKDPAAVHMDVDEEGRVTGLF